jgi:AraC family transcriptional regulator of adaptative response/methylated-DNA-[protein]-cysteine methyltransferase
MQKIIYGYASSPFGVDMVIGQTDIGVCWIGFQVEGYKGNGESRMRDFFPRATFYQDQHQIESQGKYILDAWRTDRLRSVVMDIYSTPFQQKVWQALLDIPKGDAVSYGDIARQIGLPKAARAVGSAVGENPVSLIIPCHRVITASGLIGNYGWGTDLKAKILQAEDALHRVKAGRLAA